HVSTGSGGRGARDSAEPFDVAPCQFLCFSAVGCNSGRGSGDPVAPQLPGAFLPLLLFFGAHAAPPSVTCGVSVLAPALLYLVLVLSVVEAIKHVLCHVISIPFQGLNGLPHGRDLSRQTVLLLPKPFQVAAQRLNGVGLPGQHVGDCRQTQSKFPEQEDPLKLHQGRTVVIAIAVMTGPAWLEQPNVVVVTQRGAGCPCHLGDFLDRPVHESSVLALSFLACPLTVMVDVTSRSRGWIGGISLPGSGTARGGFHRASRSLPCVARRLPQRGTGGRRP